MHNISTNYYVLINIQVLP